MVCPVDVESLTEENFIYVKTTYIKSDTDGRIQKRFTEVLIAPPKFQVNKSAIDPSSLSILAKSKQISKANFISQSDVSKLLFEVKTRNGKSKEI